MPFIGDTQNADVKPGLSGRRNKNSKRAV